MSATAEECPCGTGRDYEECCGRYLGGEAWPETAEALMRARYTAYARANVDFIEKSTHPKARGEFDRAGTLQWAAGSDWTGLEILEVEGGVPTRSRAASTSSPTIAAKARPSITRKWRSSRVTTGAGTSSTAGRRRSSNSSAMRRRSGAMNPAPAEAARSTNVVAALKPYPGPTRWPRSSPRKPAGVGRSGPLARWSYRSGCTLRSDYRANGAAALRPGGSKLPRLTLELVEFAFALPDDQGAPAGRHAFARAPRRRRVELQVLVA